MSHLKMKIMATTLNITNSSQGVVTYAVAYINVHIVFCTGHRISKPVAHRHGDSKANSGTPGSYMQLFIPKLFYIFHAFCCS